MVPIDHTLTNGNIVEIITSSHSKGPSIDWLKIAKTSNARNKIKQWLKKENRSDSTERGKDMLEKYVRRKGYDRQQILKNQYLNRCAKNYNLSSIDDLYTAIGSGGLLLSKVVSMLLKYYHDDKQAELIRKQKSEKSSEEGRKRIKNKEPTGVTVKGIDNLLIRFSKCCNPVPGDKIIGFITKGRGISVHRKDCINIISMPEEEKQRFIEVEWDKQKENMSYDSDIHIIAEDRKGLFADLSRACEDMDVHIAGVNAKSAKDGVINITMTLSISNTSQIEKILRTLRGVQGVIDVYRAIT